MAPEFWAPMLTKTYSPTCAIIHKRIKMPMEAGFCEFSAKQFTYQSSVRCTIAPLDCAEAFQGSQVKVLTTRKFQQAQLE